MGMISSYPLILVDTMKRRKISYGPLKLKDNSLSLRTYTAGVHIPRQHRFDCTLRQVDLRSSLRNPSRRIG